MFAVGIYGSRVEKRGMGMRIKLGFNGWPPVATHLFCFFIGTIIMGQSMPSVNSDPVIRRGEVLVLADRRVERLLKKFSENRIYIFSGMGDLNTECSLNHDPVRVVHHSSSKKVFLKLTINDVENGLLGKIKAGVKLRVLGKGYGAPTRCQGRPRVHFE